jgi:DNA-binding response OmpR family regulator
VAFDSAGKEVQRAIVGRGQSVKQEPDLIRVGQIPTGERSHNGLDIDEQVIFGHPRNLSHRAHCLPWPIWRHIGATRRFIGPICLHIGQGPQGGMLSGVGARVLVVDDEPGVRRALERGLRAEGMQVVTATDGPSGLRAALTGSFDAVLLDIMLPGLSGYRVLERLRAAGVATPVLLVSAKDGEIDQANGLDLGADGYLVKPFSFVVLVAQLRAVLRRHADQRREAVVTLGDLVIDPARRRVTWAGQPVALSPREFAVLAALARRAGSVMSKDELLHAVWGDEHAASRNAVEVYVGYLRRKLDAVGAGAVLQTVRGHGYAVGTQDRP